MPANPHSIARQLLIRFPEIIEIEHRWLGPARISYYIRLPDDGPSIEDIRAFIDKRRPMGVAAFTEKWTEVTEPAGPSVQLSLELIQALESDQGTNQGLEHLIVQWFPQISSAQSQTIRGGHISVSVCARPGFTIDDALLEEITQFMKLACGGDPFIQVDVSRVEILPDNPPRRPFDIRLAPPPIDPNVQRLIEQDEDVFRTVRKNDFRDVFNDSVLDNGRSGVLVREHAGLDSVASLALIHDRIFIEMPTEEKPLIDIQLPIGAFSDQVTRGRIIPVFALPLSRYPSKMVLACHESGTSVSPRQLASRLGGLLLEQNPLWRLAWHEPRAAGDLINGVERAFDSPETTAIRPLAHSWTEYQRNACTELRALLLNHGPMVAMTHGVGALASRFYQAVHGKDLTLEFGMVGAQLTYAQALCSATFNTDFAAPYCEIIGKFSGYEKTPATDNMVPDRYLDFVIQEIGLDRPINMPLGEWFELIDDEALAECRSILRGAFSHIKSEERVVYEQAAWKLAQEVKRVRQASTGGWLVKYVGVEGLVTKALSHIAEIDSFPFNLFLKAMLKAISSKIWDGLENHPRTRNAKDLLRALNAFCPPRAVRLVRVQDRLGSG